MKKYDGKIVFVKAVQHHNIHSFAQIVNEEIEKAQKKKYLVDIKYSTEISTQGVVHNALILGRINKR